ncbi:hypothetical protein GGI19_003846 [Coemansia pectinata]|uniref:Uncharacterized protein n=1 Tax=Coemansia pectinata TaxID=1052879 RepID=A0A9W8GWX7_9FUNG|nr:hypothetical protein GGI19_003846 [Coemansia pectinata]
MDDSYISNIDSIDSVDDLRVQLRDTTTRLQSAARIGIDLATQNQALTTKLNDLAQEQEDLRRRLDLVERDRRWMQDQSLRVDQVRASLNDLLAKADGNRNRQVATDSRIDGLGAAVAKLRDEVDEQAHALDSVASVRKWAGEFSAIQRALADAQSAISSQGERLSELSESVTKCEFRRRTHATETSRVLSDLDCRASSSEASQREFQAQMDWVASHQRELQDSLQSVIQEYNTMLNEHEQAIRILGDTHAILESQVALPQTPSSRAYDLHTPVSLRSSRGSENLLTPASSAPNTVRRKPRAVALPIECISTHASDDNDQYSGSLSSPTTTAQHKGVAASQRKRDSGLGTAPPLPTLRGEVLGDIFANDNMMNNGGLESIAEVGFPSSVILRKAASVAGAPSASGSRSRSRPRQRISSFSRITAPTSPTRAAAGGLGTILSSSAHVGVGWGNYWEARRHRLQFDIQKRLAISASAISNLTVDHKDDDLSVED